MTLPADAPPLRPADLLAMLRRHRVLAVCVALLVGFTVLAAPSLLLPLRFRAEATLTMGRGLKPISFQNDPVAGLVPEQMVNTQREMLTAKPTLRSAFAMSGLLDNPAYRGAADPSALLQQRLRATVVKNTWVIQVSLDDEDPVRAEQGLQAVIDAYLAQQSTAQRSQGAEDIAFVRGQLAEAEAALQTCREQERTFRHDNAIASTDPDRNHITARIQSLAERQALLDERVTASAALLAQVRTADTIVDPTARMNAYLRIDQVSTATVVGALQQDLLRIEGQEAELSAKYLEKHPRLIEVRSLLAAKRTQLESTIAAARSAIESDHQRITAQRDALTEAQVGLQRDLDAYRGRLIELQQLIQTTAAQQKVHNELQARLTQLDALAGYDERRMSVSAP
ncbi:MAG TPA: hypothetical protein DCS97_10815, partial [Planctomycetes bacterium]|nr:hypothetical protein [Planctomycetota bacterium]